MHIFDLCCLPVLKELEECLGKVHLCAVCPESSERGAGPGEENRGKREERKRGRRKN